MARLDDAVPTLTGADRRIYERMLAARQRHGVGLYGPYGPLLHHPRLAELVERLGSYLKFDGTLPRDRYQFVVLAVAHADGAEFEWRDHVDHARQAGVPDAAIDALRAGSAPPEPYATLLDVVTTTLARRDLPQDLQDRLGADVGTTGLIEVVTLCGFYGLIGMVSAAFDVPVDEAGRH